MMLHTSHINCNCFSTAMEIKIVTIDMIELKTTICAANSWFDFAFCAIVNVDTAVGLANIAINAVSSISRKPNSTLMGIKTSGIIISFPITEMARSFLYLPILEKTKLPPSMISANGVAIPAISDIACSTKSGIFTPRKMKTNANMEAIINGFLKTSLTSADFFGLSCENIPSAITERRLNNGTTNAIKITVTPVFSLPYNACVMGMPNNT